MHTGDVLMTIHTAHYKVGGLELVVFTFFQGYVHNVMNANCYQVSLT